MERKWTKEKCIIAAEKCNYRSEFKKRFSGAWDSSFDNGWLDDVYMYLKHPANKTIKWTKEKCEIICEKYNSFSDFRKKEPQLYDAILKKKWLIELTNHMVRKNKPNSYWTKEKCVDEANKFKTKTDWINNSRGSYSAAHRNNWVNDCSQHMKKLSTNKHRIIYSFEFDNNYVYVGLTYSPNDRKKHHLGNKKSSVFKHIEKHNEKPNFKILTDFLKKEEASILEGVFLEKYKIDGWKLLNKVKTGGLGGSTKIWTKEKCINEAKKYKTKAEFKKNSYGYSAARINGWLKECCSHMENKIKPNGYWKNNKERCINEAKKYKKMYHFKIGSQGAYNAVRANKWYNEIKMIYQ